MDNNIKAMRKKTGLTQSDVADRIGLHLTNYNKLENGKTELTLSRAIEIADVLECDPTDLMVKSAKIGMDDPGPRRSDANRNALPEIDLHAGMGPGGVVAEFTDETDASGITWTSEGVIDHWGIPVPYIRNQLGASPKSVYVVTAVGDSMAPTLLPNDKVLIDTNQKTLPPDGIYAINDGTGIVLKRVEVVRPVEDRPKIRCISDNQLHTPFELEVEEGTIIGRVVCKVTAM